MDSAELESAHAKWLANPTYRKGVLGVPELARPLWDLRGTLNDALKIIAAGWAIPVPRHEEWVILKNRIDTELKRLMKRTLVASMRVMVDDVNTLKPFGMDSDEEKAVKREIVLDTIKTLNQIESEAAAHIDRDAFSSSNGKTQIIYTPGSAMRQLSDVVGHPFWDANCMQRHFCVDRTLAPFKDPFTGPSAIVPHSDRH